MTAVAIDQSLMPSVCLDWTTVQSLSSSASHGRNCIISTPTNYQGPPFIPVLLKLTHCKIHKDRECALFTFVFLLSVPLQPHVIVIKKNHQTLEFIQV